MTSLSASSAEDGSSRSNWRSAVRAALEEAGIENESAEVEFVANVLVPVDLETAKKVLAVIDAVEDLDDVQNVYVGLAG